MGQGETGGGFTGRGFLPVYFPIATCRKPQMMTATTVMMPPTKAIAMISAIALRTSPQLTVTSMAFGFAFSDLGSRRLSTPFLNSAETFASST